MNSKPLVSVVMPVRNGMPFLPEAVESILSQTWSNWELIVVEDHSTDDTASYLAQLIDPRIRVIGNSGYGFDAARASGIEAARGEFTARMDADDIAVPERIQLQVDFLAGNPEFVGIGAQVDFIAETTSIRAFRYPLTDARIRASLRAGRVTMCDSAIMFRTSAAQQVRPRMPGPGSDFDFYLQLAAHGKLRNLPQRMIQMRIGKSSMSFSKIEEQICGIAFALACDRARRSHLPEPDFADFERAWDNRPWWKRSLTKLRTWHQRLFRNAVIHRARGNSIRSVACLSASAVLWPPAIWYQLKRKLTREDPEPHANLPGSAAHHH